MTHASADRDRCASSPSPAVRPVANIVCKLRAQSDSKCVSFRRQISTPCSLIGLTLLNSCREHRHRSNKPAARFSPICTWPHGHTHLLRRWRWKICFLNTFRMRILKSHQEMDNGKTKLLENYSWTERSSGMFRAVLSRGLYVISENMFCFSPFECVF
jgi:hypothetical protein